VKTYNTVGDIYNITNCIGFGTEHISSYSKFRHNHPSLGRDLKCDELDDFVKELLDVIK
jgi:hypothetical protein